jgi:PDDEXK-like domain of unknown function (DUF3799)
MLQLTKTEKSMKIYTSTELSNERYHSEEFPQASGTILSAIHSSCPAQWRYGEKSDTSALKTGTWSHAAILESDTFNQKYIRGLDEGEHVDALFTAKDLERWLKDAGIKSRSGMTKAELSTLILDTEPEVKIWDVMMSRFEHACELVKKEIIPAKIYDTIQSMQFWLESCGYANLFTGGHAEVSIIDEEDGLKCRCDYIKSTHDTVTIIDYKTTTDVSPSFFSSQTLKYNYWIKMALQSDLVEKATGIKPKVILLAQSKKAPFLAQAYEMNDQQLAVGREQYQQAHKTFKECVSSSVWPAFGGGIMPLETPSWAMYQYGIEQEITVTEIEE